MVSSKKYNKLLLMLGIFYVIYWLFDFFYNAVISNNFSWILWYSSAGFLLTGTALIIQNELLIWSLFCALFAIEGFWTLDFLYGLLFQKSLLGFTSYINFSNFNIKPVYFTLYHILIPFGLFMAILLTRKIYKYAWVGAASFALILMFLTYLFVNPNEKVNCIYSVSHCNSIFNFLYAIKNPYRSFIMLFGLIFFIYLPTNYLLVYFKKTKKSNFQITN